MNIRACLLAMVVCGGAAQAATITYTYDPQHRLVQASYSASEKVFYNYDAAGNVDQQVTITDEKYLQSWLWYFSILGYPSDTPSAIMALLVEDTGRPSGRFHAHEKPGT